MIQGSVGLAASGERQQPVDVTLEDSDSGADEPHAAVDPAGDAVILWDANPHDGPASMQAVTFNLSTGVPGYRPPLPFVTNAAVANRRFHVRPSAHRPNIPIGTRFRFTVFPESWVNIAIEELRPGHRVGTLCVALNGGPARGSGPSCVVAEQITTLERRASAGVQSIPFSGTFQRQRVEIERVRTKAQQGRIVYLKPGNYAAVLTATNTTGTSAPVTVRFTVVRQ